MTMALAMGSVFALNALHAKWLWMLQAATPFLTFGMLGSLDITVRPSSGDNLIVMLGLLYRSVCARSGATLRHTDCGRLDRRGVLRGSGW